MVFEDFFLGRPPGMWRERQSLNKKCMDLSFNTASKRFCKCWQGYCSSVSNKSDYQTIVDTANVKFVNVLLVFVDFCIDFCQGYYRKN
jgi:hypothetical protein